MITTNSLRLITDTSAYDRIFTIMRCPKGSIYQNLFDVAPSIHLLNDARFMIVNRQFDDKYFNEEYKPTYLKEMKDEKAMKIILELKKLSEDHNILLLCNCIDKNHCHRSLLGNILKDMGCEVIIK